MVGPPQEWPPRPPKPTDENSEPQPKTARQRLLDRLSPSRDFMAKLHWRPSHSWKSVKHFLQDQALKHKMLANKMEDERQRQLGTDLAAAHFVLELGGKVMFANDATWYENDKSPRLPPRSMAGMKLEAIALDSSWINYDGLDNFDGLHGLKAMSLCNCEFVDDWCISRIANQFRNSLVQLDLSGCQKVSVAGLSTLHHLSHLRRLAIGNLSRLEGNQELVAILLEEMLPGCLIEGVDYWSEAALPTRREHSQRTSKETEAAMEHARKSTQEGGKV